MNRDELITEWLTALRSGKYSQTTGRLRKADSFCCLGVLCDISKTGQWLAVHATDDTYQQFEPYSEFKETPHGGFLPQYLEDVVQLNTQEFIIMNDEGASFEDIADEIERQYIEDDPYTSMP